MNKRFNVYKGIVDFYNTTYNGDLTIEYRKGAEFFYNPYTKNIVVSCLLDMYENFVMKDFETFLVNYLKSNIATTPYMEYVLDRIPFEIIILLHEIGHYHTLTVQIDQWDKQVIQALISKYRGKIDTKECQTEYRQVYGECLADTFAVNFLVKYLKEIIAIMEYEGVYNIVL